jgi:hypothetical protein
MPDRAPPAGPRTAAARARARAAARALAADAFVFGYPLVLMDVTRVVTMAMPQGGGRVRPNEFAHRREFPDASFTGVVSPNADTLYSTAWLDLTAEPVVLTVPDSGGRYFLLPLLSGWTDVFSSPGTRTTGPGGGAFAITGPDWRGRLPSGLRKIAAPTSMAWLIGRTQTNGKADYDSVHQFQDGLALAPLSVWATRRPADREAAAGPGTGIAAPPPDQVEAMDADTFFGRLATLLIGNPPAAADRPAVRRFSAIGLTAGSFQPGPGLADELAAGMRDGLAQIKAMREHPAGLANGWAIDRHLGRYGTDYRRRAFVAMFGLGANLPEDSIYPHTQVDAAGQPLTGTHRYVLHFAAGQAPPAQAFWSLTAYNEHQYFVPNPLSRYAIGDRDPLTFNADGSLDLWLQHDSPGAAAEANWLPAPSGPFGLILRVYWPGPAMLDGSWVPPAVTRRPG